MWTICRFQILCVLSFLLWTEVEAQDDFRSEARNALEGGQITLAIECIHDAINASDATADDYLLLGQAYFEIEEYGKSRKAFHKAVGLRAQTEGNYGIGLTFTREKSPAINAIYFFRRALGHNPNYVDAQYQLARMYLRMRPGDAIKAFEKVLVLDPDHPDAFFQIGQLRESARNLGKAMDVYQMQLKQAPGHALAKYRLGKLLMASGQPKSAVKTFRELAISGSDVEPYACLELAVLSLSTGQAQDRKSYSKPESLASPKKTARYTWTFRWLQTRTNSGRTIIHQSISGRRWQFTFGIVRIPHR